MRVPSDFRKKIFQQIRGNILWFFLILHYVKNVYEVALSEPVLLHICIEIFPYHLLSYKEYVNLVLRICLRIELIYWFCILLLLCHHTKWNVKSTEGNIFSIHNSIGLYIFLHHVSRLWWSMKWLWERSLVGSLARSIGLVNIWLLGGLLVAMPCSSF